MPRINYSDSASITCSSFLHKESHCNAAIQIALVTIFALGIALFAASFYAVIPVTIGYCGIGFSAISLVALKIFRSCLSSELDRAIDACTTFSEMEEILDQSTMSVSCLGVRCIKMGNVSGTSTLDYLAIRLEKEIASHLKPEQTITSTMTTGKTFVYDDPADETSGERLVNKIDQLFDESERIIDQEKNLFTRICYWAPRFFQSIICYNDIRSRFMGNANTIRDTIGSPHRNSEPGTKSMPSKWGINY